MIYKYIYMHYLSPPNYVIDIITLVLVLQRHKAVRPREYSVGEVGLFVSSFH